MGIDWEELLDAEGEDMAYAYDDMVPDLDDDDPSLDDYYVSLSSKVCKNF